MYKKNTIGYYLNQLPDGIREKAIANCLAQIHGDYLNHESPMVGTVAAAVKGAFRWDITPEGQEYWLKVQMQCPDYQPSSPIENIFKALVGFGELLKMLESETEPTQKKQETSTPKTETPKVEVKETVVIKPKTITAAIRQVLSDIGIKVDTRYIFSDGRKQGVSVKVCGLSLSDNQKQEVKTRMEALGYTYHRINVPSPRHGSPYYAGAFNGTRFHFS